MYLRDRNAQNEKYSKSDTKVHILPWKPQPDDIRPDSYPVLNVGNTRKSYTKVFHRGPDGVIILEKGLPAMNNYDDKTKGENIEFEIDIKPRQMKWKPKVEKPPQPPRDYAKKILSDWAKFRTGKAQQECNTRFMSTCLSFQCVFN